MKVKKWITVEQEVEVDVTAEDIAYCIKEDVDNMKSVKIGINNFSRFMKAVPESVIAEMQKETREIIATFLLEQSARFKTPEET